MQGHEKHFWEQTVATLSPGWDVRLLDEHRPGISGLDAFFYVVDLSNAWQLLVGMRTPEVLRAEAAAAKGQAEGLDILSAADQLVIEASDTQITAREDLARVVGNSVVLATTLSTVYRVVKGRFGSVGGHWMYLAYRAQGGREVVTRPAYLGRVSPGQPLSVQRLQQAAQELSHLDLVQQPGKVAAHVAAIGGSQIAECFRTR